MVHCVAWDKSTGMTDIGNMYDKLSHTQSYSFLIYTHAAKIHI